MSRPVIIVFAKAPRMGSVKTRLARQIGGARALSFYRACLARTLRTCAAMKGVETVVWTAPDNAVEGRYFPSGLKVCPQGNGDLGRRMARALAHHAGADRILIGADIPGITQEILGDAFTGLRQGDAVFGPAEDGGFWLVGLRRGYQPRGLFRNVIWSSPDTLTRSMATLPPHAGIVFAETLNDIDDLDDYRSLTSF